MICDWLEERGIKTHYIHPSSPWENDPIESFHDKRCDEFPNREVFYSLREAGILLEGWRKDYNSERIYSSLSYQIPDEFFAAASLRCGLRPPLRLAAAKNVPHQHNKS